MRTVRNHIAEIAVIVACVSVLMSAVLFKLNYDQQGDIKAALDQIQQSRVVLSRTSCHQRNAERAIARANLNQNLKQLAGITDQALAQLGFTREQAVAQIHKQLRQVHRLDCNKLIRQVAGNHVGRARSLGGGGPGAHVAPRPPTHQTASKRRTGSDGGSGAPVPERPSQPGPNHPEPAPNVGEPPGGGGGGNQQPTPPVNPPPTPKPVQSLINQIGDTANDLLQQIP